MVTKKVGKFRKLLLKFRSRIRLRVEARMIFIVYKNTFRC